MKIRPVGAEFFHVDGRTGKRQDMKKLIVAFRDFVKESEKDGRELWEHSVNPVSLTNNKFCARL